MNSNRIYGLDLVRSIAISLILLLHIGESANGFPTLLKSFSQAGWAGVDIFFVLSGFLIGGLLYREDHSLAFSTKIRNFWIKRWFRTLPLYIAVLIVYAGIKPLLGWEFNGDLWKYFLFIQNYFSPKDFAQSWSLCIEEQFYLIFPLIAYTFAVTLKNKWVWLLPLIFSLLARVYISQNYSISHGTNYAYLITFPTFTHMDGISLGVFLAFTEKSWSGFVKEHASKIFFTSAFLFVSYLLYIGKTPKGLSAIFCFTILSILSAGLVSSAKFLCIPKKLQKLFYWFATLSYGIYLWNNLFLRVIEKYFHSMHWVTSTVFYLVGTIAVSFLSYIILEKPFMNLRKKYLR